MEFLCFNNSVLCRMVNKNQLKSYFLRNVTRGSWILTSIENPSNSHATFYNPCHSNTTQDDSGVFLPRNICPYTTELKIASDKILHQEKLSHSLVRSHCGDGKAEVVLSD